MCSTQSSGQVASFRFSSQSVTRTKPTPIFLYTPENHCNFKRLALRPFDSFLSVRRLLEAAPFFLLLIYPPLRLDESNPLHLFLFLCFSSPFFSFLPSTCTTGPPLESISNVYPRPGRRVDPRDRRINLLELFRFECFVGRCSTEFWRGNKGLAARD